MMTTRIIAKRVFTRCPLTCSRIFVSVGKQPCFQLLNDTQAVFVDNTRFFSTAPKAKPSILEEFLGWVRRKTSKKRETEIQMSSRGLEILVNVSGFGKDDMKVEIVNGKLVIKGVAEDQMGKTIEIAEKIPVIDFPYSFDPENVWAEICNDLLKVIFPYSQNKDDKYKKGRYSVKWI